VGLQDTQRKVKAVYRLNDYAGVREDPVKSKQTNNLLCSNITKHTSNNGAALDYKIPSPTAYLLTVSYRIYGCTLELKLDFQYCTM
jgi:hypothetical protein